MPDEATIPDLVDLEARYRAAMPDGTDIAPIAHDEDLWAVFSQAGADLYTTDFVFEDTSMPDHHGETYRGWEGYRRAVAIFTEPFKEMIYDLERLERVGDRVVAIYRVRATARHTGIGFDARAAYVLSFRGERIAHVRSFMDPAEALRAAASAD